MLENEVWLNLVPLLSLPLNQHSLKRPDCVFVDNLITEKKIEETSLDTWNVLVGRRVLGWRKCWNKFGVGKMESELSWPNNQTISLKSFFLLWPFWYYSVSTKNVAMLWSLAVGVGIPLFLGYLPSWPRLSQRLDMHIWPRSEVEDW